ncbi:hypothetical protein CNBD0920 [Cryptococcus deneoformans B-3501A]|uniref:DASH complex subunit DUO1 n=1 Tax=Cryptococcus deneoformans (strain JEC21 / ATCC MYA-565) TaxID=214684 RepID=Q5KHS8_CRYD1|nr:hypothetical protein CND05430 [Cryptococcus neoformans var. neoformans JEC21]XP_776043.1 hypothetical protein CNBD0920 [Cryptococcus neoformans var. neoformans B-3501A]AAW43232.1 hypothetical protein CND05430 [Cryptococcus neoformans var. neoformans JEC21]EAL21396.1 hypothetical protein CNBD0920 [Cryptococcus neoformans var. neoformans B-3501A]
MDSPLLPTLSRSNYSVDEDNNGDASLSLADLSIASDGPDGLSPLPPPRQLAQHSQSQIKSLYAQESGHIGAIGGAGTESSATLGSTSTRENIPPTAISNDIQGDTGTIFMGKPRFSLFAPSRQAYEDDDRQSVMEEEGDKRTSAIEGRDDVTISNEDYEREEDGEEEDEERVRPHEHSRQRDSDGEKKLRESLYELRKFNEVFEGFIGSLEGVKGHNERLAERVQQTSLLLDEYTAILGQAEHTQRLLLNPRWTGSSDDAAAIAAEEQARAAAAAKALEEAQAAAEAAREAEEQARKSAERERAQSELRTRGGGTRGRGTVRGSGLARGSKLARGGSGLARGESGLARGGSGLARGGSGLTRGRGVGTSVTKPSVAPPRPESATASSAARRGGSTGTTGKYSHVKSSGYGPRQT